MMFMEEHSFNLMIDKRKQAEDALQKSETRYRGLFEDSPISLWEEDFSAVKTYLEDLRESGIKDFRAFFKKASWFRPPPKIPPVSAWPARPVSFRRRKSFLGVVPTGSR